MKPAAREGLKGFCGIMSLRYLPMSYHWRAVPFFSIKAYALYSRAVLDMGHAERENKK